jgi:hypothetical protein
LSGRRSTASGGVSWVSGSIVFWVEFGTPLSCIVFLAQFPFKKLGAFFLSSSNRNRGKTFAVLSKKRDEESTWIWRCLLFLLVASYVPMNSSCTVISFAEEDRKQSYKIKS